MSVEIKKKSIHVTEKLIFYSVPGALFTDVGSGRLGGEPEHRPETRGDADPSKRAGECGLGVQLWPGKCTYQCSYLLKHEST